MPGRRACWLWVLLASLQVGSSAKETRGADVLWTPDETSVQHRANIGNGHLALTLASDEAVGLHLAGVFNGPASQAKAGSEVSEVSHRAWVPAPLAEGPEGAPVGNAGAELDLQRGVYTRRTRVPATATSWQCHNYAIWQDDSWCKAGKTEDGFEYTFTGDAGKLCGECWCCKRLLRPRPEFVLEQRLYAHRTRPSLLIVEVSAEWEGGPERLPISVAHPAHNFRCAKDFHMLATEVLPPAHGRGFVWSGTTKVAETGSQPVEVALATTAQSAMEIVRGRKTILVGAYRTSLDSESPSLEARADLRIALEDVQSDYDKVFQQHEAAWASMWAVANFSSPGRPDMERAVKASTYYILSALRSDRHYSLSPGGLATQGYNGHTFWDTETWMFPPMLVWFPSLAASILDYRCDRLPGARGKAASYTPPFAGAMFPWESAFSGFETSPSGVFGQLEQHISADIALAVRQYYRMTGDLEWLRSKGYPLLAGVADFYASKASRPSRQRRLADAKGGCESMCKVHGEWAACKSRVQWSREHETQNMLKPCHAAHLSVMRQCSAFCPTCSVRDVCAVSAPAPPQVTVPKLQPASLEESACTSMLDCTSQECSMPGEKKMVVCVRGACHNGAVDPRCQGVPNSERYAGMQDGTWCWDGRKEARCKALPQAVHATAEEAAEVGAALASAPPAGDNRAPSTPSHYHLSNVVGPDEWHTASDNGVSDSIYTNFAAREALLFAAEAAQLVDSAADARWAVVGDGLALPFDEKMQRHPEFDGYKWGDTVKQADVVLLPYPLGMHMSKSQQRNDLDYYSSVTDKSQPAMTWGMHAIGHLALGDTARAAALFDRSFQTYIQPPFNVWSEMPVGGITNFITGAGGFLQAVMFGYFGIRITKDALVLSPTLIEGASSTKLSGVNYLGRVLSVQCSSTNAVVTLEEGLPLRTKIVRAEQEDTVSLGNVSAGGQVVFNLGAKLMLSALDASGHGGLDANFDRFLARDTIAADGDDRATTRDDAEDSRGAAMTLETDAAAVPPRASHALASPGKLGTRTLSAAAAGLLLLLPLIAFAWRGYACGQDGMQRTGVLPRARKGDEYANLPADVAAGHRGDARLADGSA